MLTIPRLGRHPLERMVAVVGLFSALTFAMAFPLSMEPGSRALDLGADTRLFLWTLSWDVHALGNHPWSVFDANIFYPETNTLAYSEHLIGSALVGAPWLVASGNPLLAMNAVVLLSCVLSGLGAYLLATRLDVGTGGALAAGIIFAFAPPRFFRLGQIHLATVQWIPFCLAYLHTYASGGSRRHIIAAAVFFTLQALSGGQSGLFLLLASAGLAVYLWATGQLRPRGSLVRDGLWAVALALVLNVPFLLPYLEVQRDAGLTRSLAEAEEWSPNAESFLAAPTHAQGALLAAVPGLRRKILGRASGYLFPGFFTLVLAGFAFVRRRPLDPSAPIDDRPPPRIVAVVDALILISAAVALLIRASGGIRWEIAGFTVSARNAGRAGLVFVTLLVSRLALFRKSPFAFAAQVRGVGLSFRRHLDARMGIPAGYYILLMGLSLWAALGPRFGLYAALYRLLPGFDFTRVPARLTILTLLGLAILAGIGFDRITQANRTKPRLLLGAALLVILPVEFAAFPLDAPTYRLSIPAVEKRLAEYPAKLAIVELPVPDPRDAIDSARFHSLYMLYSTRHWHDLVNGYSGFRPPSHDSLFRKLVNFPDEASLAALEDLGVTFAVLHRDLYRRDEWLEVEKRLETYSQRLTLELEEGESRVYRLTPP